MAPATVRADYDQLKQVASAFSQNVQTTQQLLQSIKQNKEVLQGGDWVGQGATAFYKEMDDSVLPTLQRLVSALDTAASNTAQISSIMKDAEDQAANVLKGTGAAGAGSVAVGGGASTPTGPGSGSAAGSGSPAAGGGAGGSAGSGKPTTGGGSSSGAGSSASDAGASAATMTPPDTSQSAATTFHELYDSLGAAGGLISILEAEGASAFAVGVVGTSIGAILLPISAFLLGTEIAEEHERKEALMSEFKMKLTGTAKLAAVQGARSQLQAAGLPIKPLNDQGIAAVTQVNDRWRDQMEGDINRQLVTDTMINHSHPEAAWQGHYDEWIKGMSKDLANIYANPLMTK